MISTFAVRVNTNLFPPVTLTVLATTPREAAYKAGSALLSIHAEAGMDNVRVTSATPGKATPLGDLDDMLMDI